MRSLTLSEREKRRYQNAEKEEHQAMDRRHLLNGYDKDGDTWRMEIDMSEKFSLKKLQEIFAVDAKDLLYEPRPVTPEIAERLLQNGVGPLPDHLEFYLQCVAVKVS